MNSKLAIFCVSAVFLQTITASCVNSNNALNNIYNNNAFGNAFGSNIAINNNALNNLNSINNNNNAFNNLGINNIAANNARLGNAVVNPVFSTSFPVSCQSSVPPGTVSIQSEVFMEGPLSVIGQMPFQGAVAVQGTVPTNGQGAVAYSCGNENIGIVSETLPAASTFIESGIPYVGGYGAPVYVY